MSGTFKPNGRTKRTCAASTAWRGKWGGLKKSGPHRNLCRAHGQNRPASRSRPCFILGRADRRPRRRAWRGARHGEADPAEIAAVQNLFAELDAKATAAVPGSKEQQRALAQSRNVERELLRMQGKLPGEDSEAEREAKKADWAQAFEATLSEALDEAASYGDRLQIRAEFSRLAHAHDEQQDDDKGRFRTREPDRGRTR